LLLNSSPNARGFTIVELLIVIVVIGILAAIVIVAYQGVTNRANDSSVQSDLTAIAKKLNAYKITSTTDAYPPNLITTGVDIAVSKGAYGNNYTPSGSNGYNLLYCKDSTASEFALIARSKSGNTFAIKSNGAVREAGIALTTAAQSCPDQGVTNSGAYWTFSNGNWATGL